MARTVRNPKIDTRSARAKLLPRREPYWTAITNGCALGYRKGPNGGRWTARHYDPRLQPPTRYQKIGPADDAMEPDGIAILSYAQAQEKARAWFADRARIADGHAPTRLGPYTVADAVRDYLTWYEGRGGKAKASYESSIKVHILPAFGRVDLADLTFQSIRNWHHGLGKSGASRKTRLGRPQPCKAPPTDPDGKRKRQATANRVLGILKAVLNHAWQEDRAVTDQAWRRVKPFKNVDAPVIRYLSIAECKRLINACDPEFRPLVRAALLTGCRYGELCVLQVRDVNFDADTLVIRTSKSGKPRHVVLTDESRAFFAHITAGRDSEDLIFTRTDGESWRSSDQQRPIAEACKQAKINPPATFHVLRHTHASLLAMEGVPMQVIARQLGHADTRMTEKHYAHLSPDYVAETIRAHFPKLDILDNQNLSRVA